MLLQEGKFIYFYLYFDNIFLYRPQRFLASTEAHSGRNPLGAFSTFMSKDTIKNIDVRRDEKPKVNVETEFSFMKNRIPYGATTFTYKTKKLDNDYKLNRQNIVTKDAPRNPTDHVSYDPPGSTRPQQRVYD